MPFRALLKELVLSVDGANGAIILDAEGEAVQWWGRDEIERLHLRAAYVIVMIQTCRATTSSLELGDLCYMVIEYEGARFVVEELESECFIVLEMDPSANIGQAIHRIQPAVENLRREIAA
ncbi:MAG: roadblock/LC7 domain-containing protein [Blastocatellia bacterium]|nr:roadblock/LC7 domain-containing protein [Blastocatellia bacterium]